MWDYESCKTCANNGKVCDPCMQCGEYGTSYYQGIIQDETNKISYDQALDGMKSEYPTGDELDAFLEYKRDHYILLRHNQNKEEKE